MPYNHFMQICNRWLSLISWQNLYQAWRKAAKGKRSNPEVSEFELNLERQLIQLQALLQQGNYQPAPYRSFVIQDPKRRLISAAPFADRVVHHALVQVIEADFETHFHSHSYANRVGFGTHKAIAYVRSLQNQFDYVLQCDIRQFFPSVDHAVLLEILQNRIACKQTFALCQTILQGGAGLLDAEYDMVYFAGDDLLAFARPRGLPIGNLTSQFWANVYMNELDRFVQHELGCNAYLRYVDDFCLFSNNKKQLWQWKAAIKAKLANLRLTLHERSSTVYPVKNGIPFLGMQLQPDQLRLKTRNARAFEARLKKMQTAVAAGTLPIEEATKRIAGWVAHAQNADTQALRKVIFSKYGFYPPKK